MRAELDGGLVDVDALQSLALTNYGHFTSMRVDDGRVRGLSLHLERLARDCRALFGTELDVERVRVLARRVVPGGGTGVVRVTIFDPALDLGHIGADAHPRVLVTVRPAAGSPAAPLRVRSAVHTRDTPAVKSVGLFASLRLRREAQRAGYDDVLFVNEQSAISEGATWNVGFVQGSRVVWPEAEYLPGTTMELLRQAHEHTTAAVPLADLPRYDAAFATNAAVGVRAISRIDGVTFPGNHDTVAALAERYSQLPGDPL
ncbi:aminotransferase class IV [Streptomyces specialis]|uniref:aminotransferase class IV n=1 Tax=Streptomyces specialis TaxID=498367 RepID=UPI001F1BD3CA|nr:aminotransferase class IV [Streptomyces specialis]